MAGSKHNSSHVDVDQDRCVGQSRRTSHCEAVPQLRFHFLLSDVWALGKPALAGSISCLAGTHTPQLTDEIRPQNEETRRDEVLEKQPTYINLNRNLDAK